MNNANTITVDYTFIDGMHFFTGKDAYALGLCVGHPKLKLAFNEVSIQLVNLLDVNHGVTAKVEPGVSFEEFEKWVKASQAPAASKIKPKPAAELPFEVAKAA